MISQLQDSDDRKQALRILCADDNALLGDVLYRILSLAGHSVECVGDGMTALTRMSFDLTYFDVLITDHQMPIVDGLALVRFLREAKYQGRIIVHSSALTEQDTASYRALGVDSIVVKPAGTAELLSLLEAFNAS
jgi:DNA-binding response OmpR family regulator